MKKAMSSVIFFTILAKFLGFFREILLSYFYGATGISDAYLISQVIPGTIFQFVGTGLTTCFIPLFYKIMNEAGKEEIDKFTNKIITIVLTFSTLVMLMVWLDTPLFIKLFASGFTGKTFQYAIVFTRIGISSLYFSTFVYVFNSYLQAQNIFSPTAFSIIPNSIFIMISMIAGARWNIWFLSIGSTLAVAFQLLFLAFPVKKLGFHFRLNFGWKDGHIALFFKMMLPVIVGVSVNEMNTLVDRTVASQVAVGGISALTYANSLIMFVQGGMVQPIATVCYPKITEAISKNETEKARKLLERVLETTLAILIPITFGFIMYGEDIIQILFGHGAFDDRAVKLTMEAVVFYALGICFVGIRELLSRYFYAYGDTKTPMKNATIGMLLNIGMNLFLSHFWGIAGLACATSLSAFITTLLLWQDCKRKLCGGKVQLNKRQLVMIFIATIIMACFSLVCFKILSLPLMANLIVAVLVGIVVYFTVGFLLKVNIAVEGFEFFEKVIRTKQKT